MEEVNRNISTQFKLPELAEKGTGQLIMRNKKSEIEKHLQHIELKLEKLKSFKYSAQEVLLEEGEMGNLEERSGVIGRRVQFLMWRRKKKPRRSI